MTADDGKPAHDAEAGALQIAVILESTISAGGGFSQTLNALRQIDRIARASNGALACLRRQALHFDDDHLSDEGARLVVEAVARHLDR